MHVEVVAEVELELDVVVSNYVLIILKSLIRHFLIFFKREEGVEMRGSFENHMVAGCRCVS